MVIQGQIRPYKYGEERGGSNNWNTHLLTCSRFFNRGALHFLLWELTSTRSLHNQTWKLSTSWCQHTLHVSISVNFHASLCVFMPPPVPPVAGFGSLPVSFQAALSSIDKQQRAVLLCCSVPPPLPISKKVANSS